MSIGGRHARLLPADDDRPGRPHSAARGRHASVARMPETAYRWPPLARREATRANAGAPVVATSRLFGSRLWASSHHAGKRTGGHGTKETAPIALQATRYRGWWAIAAKRGLLRFGHVTAASEKCCRLHLCASCCGNLAAFAGGCTRQWHSARRAYKLVLGGNQEIKLSQCLPTLI
jgi:hypothetical protein